MVKAIQKFGPTAVGFNMDMGERRWCIIGCYLAPNHTLKIEIIVTELRDPRRGSDILVARDFNAELAQPEGA